MASSLVVAVLLMAVAFWGVEQPEPVRAQSFWPGGQACGGPPAGRLTGDTKRAVREIAVSLRASSDSLYATIVRAHQASGTFEASRGQFYETAARASWYLVQSDPSDYLARLEYGILLYFVAHTEPYPRPWDAVELARPLDLGLVDTTTLRAAEAQLACGAQLARASGDEVTRVRADSVLRRVRRLLQSLR